MFCIAHRGASGDLPENTLEAVLAAVDQGADLIEIDIQVTKDGKLVLFHDRSLERITGDKGGVADFDLVDLLKRDVGSWKGNKFSGMRIPTFEQILRELPKHCSLIVEVKPQLKDVERGRRLERGIVELLDTHGGVSQGYVSVRDAETWEWFRSNAPRYACGLMQKKRTPIEFLQLVEKNNIGISQIRWRNYTSEDFELLRASGTQIMAFYADEPDDFDALISHQVNGILTNFPSRLREHLSRVLH